MAAALLMESSNDLVIFLKTLIVGFLPASTSVIIKGYVMGIWFGITRFIFALIPYVMLLRKK